MPQLKVAGHTPEFATANEMAILSFVRHLQLPIGEVVARLERPLEPDRCADDEPGDEDDQVEPDPGDDEPTKTRPEFPERPADKTYSEARPLAMTTLRQAVRDWKTAKERHAKAEAAFKAREVDSYEDPGDEASQIEEWETWVCTHEQNVQDTERRLMRAILTNAGRIDGTHDVHVELLERKQWGAVALDLDGVLYTVAPGLKDDPMPGEPRLYVIDGGFDSNDFGSGGGMSDDDGTEGED